MQEKRIPTLIGLLLIIVGLLSVVYLVQLRTQFLSKAEPLVQPKKILLTNLKPDQFSIFWTTDSEVEGYVNYGKNDSLGNFALDKRDMISGVRGKFKNHFVTLLNLSPNEVYHFKIVSNGVSFGGNLTNSKSCQDFFEITQNGGAFRLKLPNNTNGEVTARSIPINGFVSSDDKGNNPISGVFVCVEIPSTFPISDMTGTLGNYVIPLVSVLKQDNSLLTNLPDDTIESIYLSGSSGIKSNIKVLSLLDHPVPIIKLGGNYEFLSQSNNVVPTFTPIPTTSPSFSSLELISPLGAISDTLPTFRGKGKSGQILDIKVESSENLSATVKVDENGFWAWTPPENLSPGEHKVTITTRDDSGILQKIEKSFTVLAANPILPQSAGSPSAKLSATPTLKITLVPTATIIPTATPTIVPTLIPTEIPTATPTTPVLLNSATQSPFFIFLTIGFISVTLGIAMVFKKSV